MSLFDFFHNNPRLPGLILSILYALGGGALTAGIGFLFRRRLSHWLYPSMFNEYMDMRRKYEKAAEERNTYRVSYTKQRALIDAARIKIQSGTATILSALDEG